ncbi:hypothetical protein DVH24_017652 [Malus domestica]|uniref:Uncharacterized protein n=1 Tax=Malus domestica TaxID=3750 RepID=A0A498KB88_MALDO|nr:hypothetical protein DVH24_017652 [Malus domestica]
MESLSPSSLALAWLSGGQYRFCWKWAVWPVSLIILHPIRARERASTILLRDGWVPLFPRDDGGSLGLACRVSPLGSTEQACTILLRDGWVPLFPRDDDGSLGPLV